MKDSKPNQTAFAHHRAHVQNVRTQAYEQIMQTDKIKERERKEREKKETKKKEGKKEKTTTGKSEDRLRETRRRCEFTTKKG